VIIRVALAAAILAIPCMGADCVPVRRALVVGISNYVTGPNRKPAVKTARPVVTRIMPSGSTLRAPGTFGDLPAAVNDANAFADLLSGYEFQTANVKVLRNEQATGQEVLDNFEKVLIDPSSCREDVSVFYYSGHGSQIRNAAKVRMEDPDPYDRTLVTYDAVEGVPDVRSKELVRLYKKAVDKGIYLTVVLDSCQSGGLSRGAADLSARVRAIGEDPRVVDDVGLLDAEGKPLDLARQKNTGRSPPVLFLLAATETEKAEEHGDHGDFTKALLDKLPSHPDRAAIGDVFSDVRAAVAALRNDQHPQIDGDGRKDRDLFGDPADVMSGMIARSISGLNGAGALTLDKGRVAGLYEGCELVGATPNVAAVHLTVTKANAATSEAELRAGGPVRIPASSRFRLVHWVVPQKNITAFYYEKNAPSAAELAQAVDAVAELAAGTKVIADPTVAAGPGVVSQVWWIGSGWRLMDGSPGKGRDLGRTLDAAVVQRSVPPGAAVYVNFPLPAEAVSKVVLGKGTENDAVEVQSFAEAGFAPIYVLAGRWNAAARGIEYAWVRPGVTEEDQGGMNLPVHTLWLAADDPQLSEELTVRALKLHRIHSWLTLSSPPGGGDATEPFPYGLELRKVGTSEVLKQGESHTTKGEEYKAWITADPAKLKAITDKGRVVSRWLYVLSIDREGTIEVVAPPSGSNVGNFRPEKGKDPEPEMPLTGQEWDFRVGKPFGLDTYILLTTDEELDPGSLAASGVVSRGEGKGSNNPLGNLLTNLGTRNRGSDKPVPTTWSVQKVTVKSVEGN
jgi:Caspase domain